MKFNKVIIPVFGAMISTSAFGATLSCNNLSECIKSYSSLANEEYVTPKKLKGDGFEFNVTGDLKKIDTSLSFLLNQHGHTRIKQPTGNYTVIIPSRDVRYTPTPLIDAKDIKAVPHNYDYVMIKYKLRNKFLGKDITRSLRPFMSRYGRIIINQPPGIITLQETGINAHRLVSLVQEYDIELSKKEIEELKKEQSKERMHQHRLEMLKAKHGKERH